MKKTFVSVVVFAMAFCLNSVAQTVINLSPLTTFGTSSNGRIEPTSADPLLEIGNNQRGFSVDPITGNLVLLDTHSGSGGSSNVQGNIFALNGNTGITIGTLSTNGIAGGNYADAGAVVADDGVVYVCNQVNASTNLPFTIYRWDSIASINPPTVAFSGNIVPNQRYGVSIDIRGSGTGTQIIIGSTPNGAVASGTNVVIFTTVDGTNFIANSLGTDATAANFQEGIAFGPGNTFWAKKIGAPLRYMSFDLGTLSATTIFSFDTNALPGSLNHGPIAVDNVNHLLAAIDVSSGTTGSERVFLYDIANSNRPSLLDIKSYNPNNANSTAPPGYLDFYSGKLYSHVVNNGLAVFTNESVAMPAPTIFVQPTPYTRITSGNRFALSVGAYPAATYQWQRSQTNLAGETNASLIFASIQASNAGTYRVVVSNAVSSVISDNAQVDVVNLNDLYHLNELWAAIPVTGGGGIVSSNGGAGTPSERNIAYNALSNQVLVVRSVVGTQTAPSTDFAVHVVDGDTGQKLYDLNTNGILPVASEVNGSNPLYLCGVGAADDGAIYVCNLTPNASGGVTNNPAKMFRVYRWENSGSNSTPIVIFQGDPNGQTGNYRWGDVMTVRGSGINTQILLDNRNNGIHYVAILIPTDSTMTNWVSKGFFVDETFPWGASSTIGRSLDFGGANTFLQKARGLGLFRSGFDLENPIASKDAMFTNFTSAIGGVWLHKTLNLAAGLNLQTTGAGATPDSVNLYEVSDLNSPLLISPYNFRINHLANNNAIGWCVWAGDRLYALVGNNGLMAWELVSGPPGPPVFTKSPANSRVIIGGSITLSAALDSTAAVQWQKDDSNISGATALTYLINNAQLTNAGAYRCIASNSFGSATSLVATVTVENPADHFKLTSGWNATPESQPYVTSTGTANSPNERSFAFNSLSNQLLVVQCPPTSGANPTPPFSVQVVDATSGAKLYDLRIDNIGPIGQSEVSGQSPLNLLAIAVADDGSVYACNGTPNGSGGATNDPTKMFRVYRWENSGSNSVPVNIFTGDPAGQIGNVRWGDAMAVRGSGANTEIVLDSNQGNFGALLKPADASMATFTNYSWSSSLGSGSIGRSLQFETNNTIWEKRKGLNLLLSSYDTNSQTSVGLTNYPFQASLGPVAVDHAHNLAVGLDFFGSTNGPDAAALYDISDFSTPLLIAKYPFPENSRANANFIGQVIVAGAKAYLLDGNNGIASFNIVAPGGIAPALSIVQVGTDVQLSWPDETYILQGATNLNSPIIWTDLSTLPQTNFVESTSGTAKYYRLKK